MSVNDRVEIFAVVREFLPRIVFVQAMEEGGVGKFSIFRFAWMVLVPLQQL